MKHTDRLAMVNCPACDGRGGEYVVYNGLFGSGSSEEWAQCDACEGFARVHRVDRLAWLIGEARRESAALAPLTMPVVARTEVAV